MARIPDVEIERLKEEVSLVRLVESFRGEAGEAGQGLAGVLSFPRGRHAVAERDPRQKSVALFRLRCGGDVIAWVTKREGVSFRHAVELLKEGYAPAAGSAR